MKPYFEDDDLTIVNFEGVLSTRGQRQVKQYAFRGEPEYIDIISDSCIEAVNLANNHSKDYGDISYKDTKEVMSDNDILNFGMDDIAVTEINGIKVGMIGINALNYNGRESYPEIFEKLKKQKPDLIIASFHWVSELSSKPNYIQTDLAHHAIDNGADLVIGHHPHVLQGIEKYKGKYIVYSLGNFCFGGNSNPTDKDTMIFKQTFSFKNGKLIESRDNASVIPCSISSVTTRNNYQPTPLYGSEFKRVKSKIIKRSNGFEGIDDISFVEA